MFYLWLAVAVLFFVICNGSAFLGETGPIWRWPRPVGAPEWETDFNGKATLIFTWCATAHGLDARNLACATCHSHCFR